MSTQSIAVQKAKALAEEIVGTEPTILDGACLVTLPDIGATSGRITLKDAETFVQGSKVTSRAVRNGDLEVYPAKDLQVFNSIRAACKRILNAYSVQVGDLFLCPISQLDKVITLLEEQELKFKVELDLLGQRYDSVIEAHQKKNPDISALIQKHKVSWTAFSRSFRFRLGAVLAVNPLLGSADDLASAAALSLWDEIASDASTLHRQSFAGNQEVGQRAVSPAKKIRDKLVNLSFVHSGIDQIVNQFDEMLDALPKTGAVEGIDFLRLAHFLLGISTAENLRMMAEDSYRIELPEPAAEEVVVLQETPLMEQAATYTTTETSPVEDAWGTPAESAVQSDPFASLSESHVNHDDLNVLDDGWGGF